MLRFPPPLRASVYRRSLTRCFSSSQPRNISLVDIAVAAPIDLLNSLHGLGLPWYAALPTAAVLIRGVLVYCISARPAQKAAQVRSNLYPLASVRSMLRENEPLHLKRQRSLQFPIAKAIDIMATKWWVRTRELQNLSKPFGAHTRYSRALFHFGMLIAVTEAIRLKCGAKEGLLPLILSPFQWIRTVAEELYTTPFRPTPAATPEPTISREEMLIQRMEQAATTDEYGETVYDFSKVGPPPQAEVIPSEYFDPSMQTEGLGWFVDLTAPDPTFVLPILLWLSMSANIIFQRTVGRRNAAAAPTPSNADGTRPSEAAPKHKDILFDNTDPEAQGTLTAPVHERDKRFLGFLPPITNLQRIYLCIAMLLGTAMAKMPAAILLYFIPSLAVGWLQRRWLNAKYPIRPPIQPCKRPLRVRVRKEWSD